MTLVKLPNGDIYYKSRCGMSLDILVKAEKRGLGRVSIGYGQLYVPAELIGKRIRIKIEVVK